MLGFFGSRYIVCDSVSYWYSFPIFTFGGFLAWEDISRGNVNMQCILTGPENNKIIFSGSAGNVFKSNNSGESWRRVLRIASENRKVNGLFYSLSNLNIVYAATGNGLYRSNDSGERWTRVFKGGYQAL